MTDALPLPPNRTRESLADEVRMAVIWRSGTQILGQMLTWASTFLVLRVLSPTDYGLFAMSQVVLVLLNMVNGYGLASALVQRAEAGRLVQRQVLGMLLVLNLGLASLQFACAPLAAHYYRTPIVGDLLRVQALLYLATPFIALPQAVLTRALDFRKQAQVNFASGIAGALVALAGAFGGLGVWTLVAAPIAIFGVRAAGMTWAARTPVWPSFKFGGAGDIMRFGGMVAAGQVFWFLQSQADVFIAGRAIDAHALGIYTTSLFLTQIFVSKFVPPLNEVAFSAYARIKHDRSAVASAFLTSVRLIMVVAMPFYFGLAVTAEPLVAVVLGEKWGEAVPVVQGLAIAMPMMTLQTLYAPASDAFGRPGVAMGNAAVGAVLLPAAFLIGIRWGVPGLVAAWLAAYPIFLAVCTWRTLPVIGVRLMALLAAIAPSIVAAGVMAVIVVLATRALPPLSTMAQLAALIGIGAATYFVSLALVARATLAEVVALLRRRAR